MPSEAPTQQADALRGFLAERDVACPGCGYNLRGLTGERCPECNQGLELGVQLQDAAWGTLVGTIVALSIVAGIAGVMLAILIGGTIYFGNGPGGRGFEAFMLFGYPAIVLVIGGVPAVVLSHTRGRAWFRGRSGWDRRLMLVGAIGFSVGVIVLWFWLMFTFA